MLNQLENTTVENLCIFAQKQLSIHNLCKTDKMGSSVKDTLTAALTKLSTSKNTMDNRLNENSKKLEKCKITLTKQLSDFQKNGKQQFWRSTFSQNRQKIKKILTKKTWFS